MKTKDETLFADGFDDAILGLNVDGNIPRVVYSKSKMADIMAKEMCDDADDADDAVTEALEYLEFNTWGAFVGDGTPLYLEDRFDEDELDEEEKFAFIPMTKDDIEKISNYIFGE